MGRRVLDASALLAWMLGEPGGDTVEDSPGDDVISSVNLTEVVSRLIDLGVPEQIAIGRGMSVPCVIAPFDAELALSAAELRSSTKGRGLSLGDRACLALARREAACALTADRAWDGLNVGIQIMLVR